MSGQSTEQRGGGFRRPRVDRTSLGEQDLPNREITLSNIEIRYANLERDVQGIADIWNQDSVIEHLAGVGPAKTPPGIDLKKYRKNRPFPPILIATPDEIKEYSEKNPIKTIVAEDTLSKRLVGTVQVGLSTGFGIKFATVEKLAVLKEARGKGIGRRLIRTANAIVYSIQNPDKDYAFTGARAGIINNAEGAYAAWTLFARAGYELIGDQEANCVSWDVRKGKFVERNTWIVGIGDIPPYRRTDLARFLPKEAPHSTAK